MYGILFGNDPPPEESMPVAYRDIHIPAGSTFQFTVDVLGGPTDLTGYTAAMSIRELRNDLVPLADVSPGSFTVNPSTRQLTVRIASDETAAFNWERGVYDLLLIGPLGDDWRLTEGRVTCSQPVTID
jgi:hypothetical protein